MKRLICFLMLAVILLLTGCSFKAQVIDGDDPDNGYHQISQEEAARMMRKDDGHIILDVRRQEEYNTGHIPGAILLPNESITSERPKELPDSSQIILIYCRSGNRSKQAAQKLANMGYVNIYEFGGINSWTGEIVTEENAAKELPRAENEHSSDREEITKMKMLIGENEVPVTWEKNDSVKALKGLLPLTVQMSMYGGFEQVGPIGQSITSNDRQTTADYGDVVLYSGNQIVVFYGSNSWAYTRLGHIHLSRDEMTDLLGSGPVTITLREN